ncbi:MAG TPA: SRPBCC domain-containing protein [Solirubrobacterales bacterium]
MRLRNEAEAKQADERAPWVERETLVEASPEEVWEALTDEDRLEEWLAPDVELDPFEGGEISVRDGDDERHGTVETVEENERFAFTWSRPGEGESFVEFTIEALPGGSRLTVVETPTRSAAPNTAAGPTAIATGGWGPRLARLQRSMRFSLVA